MLNPYAFDGHYMVYHGLPSITYWKTGKKTALFPEPEFVLFLGRVLRPQPSSQAPRALIS